MVFIRVSDCDSVNIHRGHRHHASPSVRASCLHTDAEVVVALTRQLAVSGTALSNSPWASVMLAGIL